MMESNDELNINNTNNSKKIILKIENHNWGLKTIYSWSEKTWCIYDDLSVEYVVRNGEGKIKSYLHNISTEDLNQIILNIESAKFDNREVQACDGEAWEFTQYEKDNIIWQRKLGYIYGIEPLETISNILLNLVRNDSAIFLVEHFSVEKRENNMGLIKRNIISILKRLTRR